MRGNREREQECWGTVTGNQCDRGGGGGGGRCMEP